MTASGPVISARPEPEDGRVSILIDAPGKAAVSVYWAIVLPNPDDYAWNLVTTVTPMHSNGLIVYHYNAPLNVELSYKALLYAMKGDLLFADEDYTDTVTATLRTSEWRLK